MESVDDAGAEAVSAPSVDAPDLAGKAPSSAADLSATGGDVAAAAVEASGAFVEAEVPGIPTAAGDVSVGKS